MGKTKTKTKTSLLVDIEDESVRKIVSSNSLPHITLSTGADGEPGAAASLSFSIAKAAAGPEAAAKATAGAGDSGDGLTPSSNVSTVRDASPVVARLRSRAVLTAMGVETSPAEAERAEPEGATRLGVPAGGAAWHGILP